MSLLLAKLRHYGVRLSEELQIYDWLCVTVGESLIAPATAVRELGAVFDTYMTMVPHVNALSLSLPVTTSEILAKSGDSWTVTRVRKLSMPSLRRVWT